MPAETAVASIDSSSRSRLATVIGHVTVRWIGATFSIASSIALSLAVIDALGVGRVLLANPVTRLKWIVLLGAAGAVLRLLGHRSAHRMQDDSSVDAI